jgi:hypothetical protein
VGLYILFLWNDQGLDFDSRFFIGCDGLPGIGYISVHEIHQTARHYQYKVEMSYVKLLELLDNCWSLSDGERESVL